MDGTVPLDLLNVFRAVADAGSFSLAASRLGMPKSSVSRSIARLEEIARAQLVHRTTRRVALSTAGLALYERTAPLLRSLQDALGSLPEREEEPSGELRITAPNDFGAEYLAQVVPLFMRRYPGVSVDVRLTNRTVDLVAEGFDLALRASAVTAADASLVMRRLSTVDIQLYASPAYLARRGTPRTEGEAADHDWVVFRSSSASAGGAARSGPARRPAAVPALAAGGRARLTGDDFQFVRMSLRAGAGIGALPAFLGQPDVAAGHLVRVLPRYAEPGGRFVLLYPRAHQTAKKVVAFRDFLVESLAGRPLNALGALSGPAAG